LIPRLRLATELLMRLPLSLQLPLEPYDLLLLLPAVRLQLFVSSRNPLQLGQRRRQPFLDLHTDSGLRRPLSARIVALLAQRPHSAAQVVHVGRHHASPSSSGQTIRGSTRTTWPSRTTTRHRSPASSRSHSNRPLKLWPGNDAIAS